MANGLQVVATRLLVADVGVEGGVARRASEVLTLAEGNVFIFGILIALG